MPARRTRPSRRALAIRRRVLRLLTMLTVAAVFLVPTTEQAMAQDMTLPPLSMQPLRNLAAWLTGGDPDWGDLPHQQGGTAAGRGHRTSAAQTHAGGGAGSKAGKGLGELPRYEPFARKAAGGASAGTKKGFNAATSRRIAAKSTADTDWYENADGTVSRKVSDGPLNYRDAKGVWQPIDTGLAQGGGRWRQKANALGVDFAAQSADRAVATLSTDANHSVSYGLKGAAQVTGTASGQTVNYPAVLPDTDLQLTSAATGLKESVVLRSAKAGNTWDFPLDLKGLTPSLNADGGVDLKDAKGTVTATIPAPYAFDSKIDPVSGDRATTHAVTYRLVTDGATPVLRMTLDARWLNDPARVFPVTVDPSVSVWDKIRSTYAESNFPTGDHSNEQFIKVGSYDSGTHSANSFVQEWRKTFDSSGVSLISAHLWLYDVWASTCTPETFYVAQVTQDWTPSSVTSYPGPNHGGAIGSLTPTVNNACHNTTGSPTGGDWVTVSLDTASIQNWANGTTADYGLAVYAPTTDNLHWKQFASIANPGVEPYVVYDYTGNLAPQVEATFPQNNAPVTTLTPELQAFADDDGAASSLQYQFQVYDPAGTKVADSGLVAGAGWTVPAGKLKWGQTYYWEAQAYDGQLYSAGSPWSAFTAQVPQPLITSTLSQNGDARGFDPAIGNFTKEVTDAEVNTSGPSLDVVRDYNSRDFRTAGAFGSGWSSIFDAKATEQRDAAGNLVGVTVTYPQGSQVGFGRNSDGTFSPPQGRFASLRAVTGGYTLTDKNATVYTFTQALTGSYGITSVADAAGRAVTFTWTAGHVTTMASAVSQRSLNLTWSTPAGAANAHVATVVTDPVTPGTPASALTWTYTYSGDQLSKVCSPTDTATCSQYGYTSGSQFQTQVLDVGASSLWQFNEASGSTALSSVGLNEGSDNATYSNVTLGQGGPLAGSTATGAGFNGTSSYVELPAGLAAGATQLSMSMWFKTTSSTAGVLFSYSTLPISAGSSLAQYTPSIYLDNHGRVNAEFWYSGQVHPIISSPVNDGNWHQVVLSGAGSTQSLYLDGAKVGTNTGMISYSGGYTSSLQGHTYIGAGFLGGVWPDEPNYSTTSNTGRATYFNGTIAQAAFYPKGLTAEQVASVYNAGKNPAQLLTSMTRPSGKQFAQVVYDTNAARVSQVTDANGGQWQIGTPAIAGSSQVYRSSVLGAAPAGYWRLGDGVGASQAWDEVNYGKATYANVTLGQGGPFADTPAAKFNGSSSYVQLPNTTVVGTGPQSVELWFNHPAGNTSGGVLFDYAGASLTGGSPASNSYVPALYVGTDGKLRGRFWGFGYVTTGGNVNDGKWHHVVLSASKTSETMYLDGNAVGTSTGTFTASNSQYVYIGAGEAAGWPSAPTNTLGYFPGSIAEAAFYRTQLSGNDVAAHWQAGQNSGGLAPVETVNVTEPGGRTLVHQYDPNNGYRTVAETDGDGNRTSYGYDSGGFLYTVTDPNGNVTTTGHDVRGNTVSTTSCQNQAAGTCSTRYYSYWPDATTAVLTTADPRNDVLLTVRDPRSSSATDNTYLTTYGYDAAGNRTTITGPPVPGFPGGRTTTTTFSDGTAAYPAADSGNVPAGLAVKATSPGGATNTIAYLHNGDVDSTVDAAGLKTTYTYDGVGRPLSKTVLSDTYPAGLRTGYTYDGLGQVVQETSPAITDQVTGATHTPRTTTVFDTDGNVTSQTVADTTGGDAPRTETTAYDQWNHVLSRTDANGNAGYGNGATTTYTYDSNGNLAQETDPAGNALKYTYNSDGQLLTQSLLNYTGDPLNPSAGSTLVESSRAYDPAGRLASVTDSMGNTTAYTYTDDGLTATVVRSDSTGSNRFTLQSNVYDSAGNLTRQTTGNGATVTDYQVDAASRNTGTTLDPSGAARTTAVSYTPDDLVATTHEYDASGYDRTTTSGYDNAGRLTSSTLHGDASGHPNGWWKLDQTSGTTVTDNSGTGNTAAASGVTWATDGNGVTSAKFTSTAGQQIATNGPVLNTTGSYTVSAWVNLSSLPTGNAAVVAQSGTKNSEFVLGYHPTGTGTAVWTLWNVSTDAAGPAFMYASSTAAPVANTWTHLVGVYDPSGGSMKLYVNGALAGSTTNSAPWQAAGQLTIGRDLWQGNPTDLLPGQVSNVQVYQRAVSAGEAQTLYTNGRTGGTVGSNTTQTTKYAYDKRGLLTMKIDANGEHTDFDYDEAGNRVMVSLPTTMVERTGGTPVQASPTSFTGYDTFGEVVEELDANGQQTRYTYDANGEQTSTKAPSYTPPGASTPITPVSTQAYDNLGNVTTRTRPDGKSTSYLYDQLGQLAQETAPDGSTTRYSYDTNGDTLSVTDASGAVHQATYDWLGRQVTSTTLERYPTTQTITATSSYAATTGNPFGAHLASQTSAEGRTTSYGYNGAGEVTSTTDPVGNITRYTYDFTGQRQKTTAPDGTWSTVDHRADGLPVSARSYDAASVLLAQSSRTYDGVGNLLSTTDARGSTSTFTYDTTGMLTSESQPVTAGTSITTTFGYDALGHRTRFTDGRGNAWKYTFNSWGMPESVIAPNTATYTAAADSTTTYVYDQLGRTSQVNLPGGVTQTMGYDLLGRLTSQSGAGSEAATATRNFTYDAVGQVKTAATTEVGTVGQAGYQAATSESFGYDDRGDLLTATGSAGSSSFAYGKDGLMSSRTDAAGTTGYTYDNAGRLATLSDPATGNTLTYTYNALSQPATVNYGASGQDRTFTYNSRHQLTGDTLKKGATTLASVGYGYDADGNLTSKNTTGVAGASNNTYTYDLANRLTSWNNGTATTAYSYDASGNRIQVGSNVYTYDERDQLTSDGQHTYRYSARGTMTEDRTGGTPSVYASDAFNQQITTGQQNYGLDAFGRMITSGTQATGNRTLQYSGAENLVASDGTNTYTWDPTGSIVGINTPGGAASTGRLALTDQHDDVIGEFGAGSTALTGSRSYDPLGNTTAATGFVGQLGFQSGWTEASTGKVNMGSRWYNPGSGQFLNKDTVALDPAPTSVSANPFAYVNDNPLAGTDPDGHCSWYDVVCGAKKAISTVSNAVSSAWNTASSYVSSAYEWAEDRMSRAYHYVAQQVTAVVQTVKRAVTTVVHRVVDYGRRVVKAAKRVYHHTVTTVRNTVKAAVHKVTTAYHAVAKKVTNSAVYKATKTVAKAAVATVNKAATASANYVKQHAAAITSFVVSTAVFAGCEAFTAGVGTIGCAAMAGAAGALVEQGFKCAQTGGQACSLGAFGGAALEGGIAGAIGGGLGVLGGKLLSNLAPKAMSAIGGLFGKAATETAETVAADATQAAGRKVAGEEAASAVDNVAAKAESRAGREAQSKPGCHSFTGDTPVVMGDGASKPIDQVKIGDTVTNSVPGQQGTQTHTVTDVIVTTTDHDFVDLTVTPTGADKAGASTEAPAKKSGVIRKTMLGLAAGVAALSFWAGTGDQQAQAAENPSVTATTTATVQSSDDHTLTTTYHHPFYDETQQAFVEAKDLNPGDVLQTPTGTAQVTGLRLYHADETTYDLTIGDLHTYYVEAGSTPVLVHNCSPDERAHARASENAARSSRPGNSTSEEGATGGYLWIKGHGEFDLSSDRLHPLIRANMRDIPASASPAPGKFFGSHVEVQAATIMRILARKSGAESEGLVGRLMVSKPGGPCGFCSSEVAEMLPANSSLAVRSQLRQVFSEVLF
ncbi:LamG-like jellyroll fold domain-containing protein [Kitasatospora sp. NPDC085879]|uniref:LamG-like jellyroll fold domain-containing protein n=1 Tax=Kitasatospora sp. NPDC085879 TaxID=3154769 RepID=UPI00342D5431